MQSGRLIAVLALVAPLAPAGACPWHGDMFGGEPGGYLAEPVSLGPTDQASGPAAASQSAEPEPSRDELMARQRAVFLARYPGLAAGATPAQPVAQSVIPPGSE